MFRRFFGQRVHYKFYKCTRRCLVRDWLKSKNEKTTTPPNVLFPGLAPGDLSVTRYEDPSHSKKQPHSGLSRISAKPKRIDTCVANTKRSDTCRANIHLWFMFSFLENKEFFLPRVFVCSYVMYSILFFYSIILYSINRILHYLLPG